VAGFREDGDEPSDSAKGCAILFFGARCTLKLFSYLPLGFTRLFFPFHFTTKILYLFLTFRILSTCPISLIILDYVNGNIYEATNSIIFFNIDENTVCGLSQGLTYLLGRRLTLPSDLDSYVGGSVSFW
jgi:hypothetical protein